MLTEAQRQELIVARLVKYLHELRADTKRISGCLGYGRAVQGATEGYADAILAKHGEGDRLVGTDLPNRTIQKG